MNNKELAELFYRLAVERQNGYLNIPETSLIYIQRQVEKSLPPEEQQAFNSYCGILYWRGF